MAIADLELVRLRKVYRGGVVAVEAFDLRVAKGEFISFVGPSGCGKTTTLRMIAGLEEITSGDLIIRGRNHTDTPAERRPTSTVFQNYALFPHMTVRENVAFGLEIRRLGADETRRRTEALIERLGLSDVMGRRERELSGGQKQRVALARALVVEPEILLLDEPLGALDANLRKSIQEELKILQRDLDITFVFVTHAQSEALSMGDRVVVMNAGQVEQIDVPLDLYTRPRTPFVARFIGRNKIVPGTLAALEGGRATVSTPHGPLRGMAAFDEAPRDAKALVAVPSEFVTIGALGAEAGGRDRLAGRVTALDRVGRAVLVTAELADGQIVRLEARADALAEQGIAAGNETELSWEPDRATVILDAA